MSSKRIAAQGGKHRWKYVPPGGIEQNELYHPLKSVDGEVVGHICVECGRLSTAPHRPGCVTGGATFPSDRIARAERLVIEQARLYFAPLLRNGELHVAAHDQLLDAVRALEALKGGVNG